MDSESKNTERIAIPGRFQKGNPGKPKGAQNKSTKAAKEAIAEAFEGLGGVPRLMEWVQEDALNARVFYGNIWPKIVPFAAEVTGADGGPVKTVTQIIVESVAAQGAVPAEDRPDPVQP